MTRVSFRSLGGVALAACSVRSIFTSTRGGRSRQSRARYMEGLEPRRLLSGGYTYVPLASFGAGGPVGSTPQGQLAILQGNLFGFTSSGGANGTGAAYEVQPGNPTPILLASLPAASKSSSGSSGVATGPVVDAAGNLFGAIQAGTNGGTVFEIANGSGALTTLATFNSATTGSAPGGNLTLDSAGDLFGTTSQGGANGAGTVWELHKGSTSITSLASFSPTIVNGLSQNSNPASIVMDAGGDLFGTTASGGANGFGTVWELPKGSGSIRTLGSFNGTDGMTPTGQIAVDRFGDLYGVTEFGGASFNSQSTPKGAGTVWEIPAAGGQIADLASVTNRSGGQFPVGGVVRDPNGNLFGTTSAGGFAGAGTVWEIPNGTTHLTTIEAFQTTNGAAPRGGLVTDSFGDVFGTTSAGGPDQGGTLFEMDLGGASFSAADLTATVVRTTLPSSVPAGKAAHGTAVVAISNASASAVRGNFTVNVYAAPSGTIDSTATLIGTTTRPIQVRRNGTTVVSVPVTLTPSDTTGDMTLLAQVVDAAGNASNVSTGPTVTVAQPAVSLSETFTRVTLPTTLVSGARTRGVVTLQITNDGNVTSLGPVQIALVLSPTDGSTGTPIAGATRLLTIPPGRSTRVRIPVSSIPDGLNGTFTLGAQVTDPGGDMSVVDSGIVFTVSPSA